MRSNRLIFSLLVIIGAALISGCAAGAGAANSWPGLTVDGNIAYLAFASSVYAVDVTDGSQEWIFPGENAEVDGNPSFFAPPAVNGEQLVVGDYSKVLRILNIENGREETNGGVWPFTGAGNLYIGRALTLDSNIFAPNSDGNLFAIQPDGEEYWDVPFFTEQGFWVEPITDGDNIYIPSQDHNLYALESSTGDQIWSLDLGGASQSSPALSEDGVLYIGSFNSQMWAVDSEDGRKIWEYPTDAVIWGGAVLGGDQLYFGDLDGNLYSVDASSGREIWKESVGSPILSAPLLVDDTLFISTEGGTLFLFSTEGNYLDEKVIEGAQLFTSPVLAGDLVLVSPMGLENTLLIAYTLEGRRDWTFPPPPIE